MKSVAVSSIERRIDEETGERVLLEAAGGRSPAASEALRCIETGFSKRLSEPIITENRCGGARGDHSDAAGPKVRPMTRVLVVEYDLRTAEETRAALKRPRFRRGVRRVSLPSSDREVLDMDETDEAAGE